MKSLSRVRLNQPHGLQPTRLLHPWDFPGKSTGVGCHCLLRTDTINVAYYGAQYLNVMPQKATESGATESASLKLLCKGNRTQVSCKAEFWNTNWTWMWTSTRQQLPLGPSLECVRASRWLWGARSQEDRGQRGRAMPQRAFSGKSGFSMKSHSCPESINDLWLKNYSVDAGSKLHSMCCILTTKFITLSKILS